VGSIVIHFVTWPTSSVTCVSPMSKSNALAPVVEMSMCERSLHTYLTGD
jgi:hypothetical protein